MNKYGKAAIMAVTLIKGNPKMMPVEAWKSATNMIFGKDNTGRFKGCPKNTFLALCETGRVKYVPKNDYTRSVINKKYAIDALELLSDQPELANTPSELWKRIPHENDEIKHNSQMEVVLALWNDNLIELN